MKFNCELNFHRSKKLDQLITVVCYLVFSKCVQFSTRIILGWKWRIILVQIYAWWCNVTWAFLIVYYYWRYTFIWQYSMICYYSSSSSRVEVMPSYRHLPISSEVSCHCIYISSVFVFACKVRAARVQMCNINNKNMILGVTTCMVAAFA